MVKIKATFKSRLKRAVGIFSSKRPLRVRIVMRQQRSTLWFLSLSAANMSHGGLSVLIPLMILALNGTVVDVSLALSLNNFMLVLGAYFFGHVSDAYGDRKTVFIFSLGVVTAASALMFFSDSLLEVSLLFGAVGFASAAMQPSVNLVIVETFPKSLWGRVFGRSSSYSVLGMSLGTITGATLTSLTDLRMVFLIYSASSLVAMVLAYRLMPEPEITFERNLLVAFEDVFRHRLMNLPLLFLRVPSPNDFKAFWRMIKSSLSRRIPLLYFLSLVFWVSSSIFFTSFTPFLKVYGASDSEVFAAWTSVFMVNAVSFNFAASVARKLGEENAASLGAFLRSFGTLLATIIAFLPRVVNIFLPALLVLVFMGISFTIAMTSFSTLVFRTLQAGKQGGMLGIYSALTGAGILAGSLVSGYTSASLGYSVTFGISTSLFILIGFLIRYAGRLPYA